MKNKDKTIINFSEKIKEKSQFFIYIYIVYIYIYIYIYICIHSGFSNTCISILKYSGPSLSVGDMFQVPRQTHETVDSTKSYSYIDIYAMFFLYTHANEFVHAKSLLACLTLCDPMDCSCQAPLSIGILQARILEWVTMPSSRGSY